MLVLMLGLLLVLLLKYPGTDSGNASFDAACAALPGSANGSNN